MTVALPSLHLHGIHPNGRIGFGEGDEKQSYGHFGLLSRLRCDSDGRWDFGFAPPFRLSRNALTDMGLGSSLRRSVRTFLGRPFHAERLRRGCPVGR